MLVPGCFPQNYLPKRGVYEGKIFHKHTQACFWTHYINIKEELLQQKQNQCKTSTSGIRITPFILASV